VPHIATRFGALAIIRPLRSLQRSRALYPPNATGLVGYQAVWILLRRARQKSFHSVAITIDRASKATTRLARVVP
jgi:hypothetical protein